MSDKEVVAEEAKAAKGSAGEGLPSKAGHAPARKYMKRSMSTFFILFYTSLLLTSTSFDVCFWAWWILYLGHVGGRRVPEAKMSPGREMALQAPEAAEPSTSVQGMAMSKQDSMLAELPKIDSGQVTKSKPTSSEFKKVVGHTASGFLCVVSVETSDHLLPIFLLNPFLPLSFLQHQPQGASSGRANASGFRSQNIQMQPRESGSQPTQHIKGVH